MAKIIKYGVTEALKKGISRVIKDSEESGMIIFTRNGEDVALMIPITLDGLSNFKKLFNSVAPKNKEDQQKLNLIKDFIENMPVRSDWKPFKSGGGK